ncbi:hypothetical protein ANN_17150 [Periplaneta americana]|uniref:Vps52 C-terminal domain-containing protein n=1 Tax=Periplaneta americana TaxID=6978 RepID=A0ABQ8SSQ5_PERAM|nr:hypothetical protein ANN_17150 [Periplaneta americana]
MRSTFSSDTLRLECLPALDNKLPVSLSCLSHFIIETEQYCLVDNACREYLFLAEFFIVQGPQALELFNQILGKTLNLLVITRRYAEFSAALVGISESFPSELVNRLLAELQEEVECFILRMAAIFPGRKEQLIFVINNYDMVLGVLMYELLF